MIRPAGAMPGRVQSIPRKGDQDFGKEIEKIMLSRFVFPGIVIDNNLIIVQFFGNTSSYLSPVTGKATLNVLKMVREDLVVELRGLIQAVQKSIKPAVSRDIIVREKKLVRSVSIEVLPYHTT
ncbi:MAG: hypothetical protein WDO14_15310 [Bacteroidota bacterium]